MSNHKLITNAITAVLALGMTTVASSAAEAISTRAGEIPNMEKCYGVTKAGLNDCSTRAHHCSGESKIDGDREAWILVPEGLCRRLVGGSTTPPLKR